MKTKQIIKRLKIEIEEELNLTTDEYELQEAYERNRQCIMDMMTSILTETYPTQLHLSSHNPETANKG